jgi:NAD(P)-dependent dehydrogenase (short-subunit alcohol dehydrogenase family)
MTEQVVRPVALVSGANLGIGRAVARQLAERGHEVLLGARDPQAGKAVAEELSRETGGSLHPLTLDVSSPESIERAPTEVSSRPGRLDVLVNNASVGLDFGVSGTEPDFEVLQRTLETNFFGSYRLTIAVLGLLRASEHPRRERLEWHGRRGGDGRVVSRLPGLEGRHERDDAHPLDGARRRGHPGQLRLPGIRGQRHGSAEGHPEVR